MKSLLCTSCVSSPALDLLSPFFSVDSVSVDNVSETTLLEPTLKQLEDQERKRKASQSMLASKSVYRHICYRGIDDF